MQIPVVTQKTRSMRSRSCDACSGSQGTSTATSTAATAATSPTTSSRTSAPLRTGLRLFQQGGGCIVMVVSIPGIARKWGEAMGLGRREVEPGAALQRTVDDLRRLDESRSTFVTIASHELRTDRRRVRDRIDPLAPPPLPRRRPSPPAARRAVPTGHTPPPARRPAARPLPARRRRWRSRSQALPCERPARQRAEPDGVRPRLRRAARRRSRPRARARPARVRRHRLEPARQRAPLRGAPVEVRVAGSAPLRVLVEDRGEASSRPLFRSSSSASRGARPPGGYDPRAPASGLRSPSSSPAAWAAASTTRPATRAARGSRSSFLGRVSRGQLDDERRAAAVRRLDPDPAVHAPHQLAADVQPEARAADAASELRSSR